MTYFAEKSGTKTYEILEGNLARGTAEAYILKQFAAWQTDGKLTLQRQLRVLETAERVIYDRCEWQYSSFCRGILAQAKNNLEHWGEKAFPLSDKQIACFLRELQSESWRVAPKVEA